MTTAPNPVLPPTRLSRPGERRVLLIDDHRVFTDALAFALDARSDLRVVAVANSMHEGLTKAAVHDFDVAVIDLQLSDGDGLAVLAELRLIRPSALLIVLTGQPLPDLAAAAHRAGADAFLAKNDALHALLGVIRDTTRCPVPATARRRAGGPLLTPREHEVLALLAAGADARRIARDLCLSVYTVRDYIKTILAKLGVHSQHAAVAAAAELGLVAAGPRLR